MTQPAVLLRRGLICLWPVAGFLALRSVADPAPLGSPQTPVQQRLTAPPRTDPDPRPGARLSARNPFRADHAASAPIPQAPVAVALRLGSPADPLPRVTAVVVGVESAVVVEGLPGIETPRVLRVGDVVAGLRVTSIRFTDVTLRGAERTLRLTLPAASRANP